MGAIAQYRAESKDSKSLDSAIFATQKSNQCGSASAPTDTRPCHGGKKCVKKMQECIFSIFA
ncbi:hypothetical protein [uncultured Helicobacter sp.]|uniref:hypothetical protein n=1 Tax=uncultured Helicobacter sp. TaxID=175537 RepID=UPI0037506A2D